MCDGRRLVLGGGGGWGKAQPLPTATDHQEDHGYDDDNEDEPPDAKSYDRPFADRAIGARRLFRAFVTGARSVGIRDRAYG